ncbi:MAG: hypothetical protein LH470_10605 [Lysobacter sp.]|nr:hypothetical protein [Lysobacter sp.]
MEKNRRRHEAESARLLKHELNMEQLAALNMPEQFGWYLKFVRHDLPRPPVAILCDPDTRKYAILDEHGELHENPTSENFR